MKTQRGFTLIELLVVIAIIAILAAILFPVFLEAKEKSRQAKCLSNCKQIGIAAQMYFDDWNGLLLDADNLAAGGQSELSRATAYFTALYRYTKTYGAWMCPSDIDKPKAADGETSYKINQWVCMGGSLSRIALPSKCWLIVDAKPRSQWYNARWIQMTVFAGPHWFYHATRARHNGGYNITYVDGHAAWHRQFRASSDKTSYAEDEIPNWAGGTSHYSPAQKAFAFGRYSGEPWD